MKTGTEENGIRKHGAFILIFMPFVIGLAVSHFWRTAPALSFDEALLLLLICLVLSGSSVYGFVTTPLALILFGFCTSAVIRRIPAESLSMRSRLQAACELLPWFLAVFIAAYVGLLSSEGLLKASGIKTGEKLKRCLLVSLIQIVLIVGAYFASRLIPIS